MTSTYQPEYLGGKIICHSGGLWSGERPFPGVSVPVILDNIMIHRLIPKADKTLLLRRCLNHLCRKIYDKTGQVAYMQDVTGYLEENKNRFGGPVIPFKR